MKLREGRAPEFVAHILEAIDAIAEYTEHMDETGFLASRLVRHAVLLNIQIVGEAAGRILRLAPAFAASHPEIPWQQAYTTRNRLAHGYDSVNLAVVWQVITRELPALAVKLRGRATGSTQ